MTSKIDRTWNPTIGCAKVSAGCQNCDAERKAGRAVFLPERLIEPLRWRKPSRVFVDSMSDLFHEDITFDQIAAIFGVMAATPHHTYQVLTKRPERMVEFFRWLDETAFAVSEDIDEARSDLLLLAAEEHGRLRVWSGDESRDDPAWVAALKRSNLYDEDGRDFVSATWPLPNVHLGVSVEHQKAAEERIPLLIQCPAALRFLSVEPLLGPVSLEYAAFNGADSFGQLPGIGWVIVGGESGPNARPCHVGWIRSIVKQCRIAGVPVFVKRLGARPMVRFDDVDDKTFAELEAADMEAAEALRSGCSRVLRPKDRKGGDPSEWPQDLRVRQLPHQLPEK